MANRSLIAGAGLLGASKKFNPIGSTIAQSFVDAKGNTSALLRAKKAKINQRTASYIGALNSDVDVTQLDSSQQATVKNYLVEQKQIYADTANALARTDPSDPSYMGMVDEINSIQSSFVNLASELKGYKEDKLNYIKDFDNGALSDGNDVGTLGRASKIYTNEGIMNITTGGSLSFWDENNKSFNSYKQSKKPFLKDFRGADSIMQINQNVYSSGKVLQGTRKNMIRQQVSQIISKGGRNSLLSLASDDFVVEGGLNLQDPSLFEPGNEEMLKDAVLNSYMDAFVESSIQGANEKRPASGASGYNGAVQDEINANAPIAEQALQMATDTANNPGAVAQFVNSLDSSSTDAKYMSRDELYGLFLENEEIDNNQESINKFIKTYGNFGIFRFNPSNPSYSRGLNVDISDPKQLYNFYIDNSGLGKRARNHFINAYPTKEKNNSNSSNKGSLDNI